ncbi:MAG: LexA family protein [Weeksellaceae bacterium]
MEDNLLPALRTFYRRNRRLPSYSEMLKIFEVASKRTVSIYMDKLVDEGFLKKDNKKLSPTRMFFAIPVYGMIQAGYPIIADQTREYLTLDEYLIDQPDKSFLLRVRGDSMMNAGIFEGDLVVIERKGSPGDGEVVLAEIDNEWTLKVLKKDSKTDKVHLEAANPKYPNFYPKRELKIHGVVKAVMRKMGRVN